MGCFVFVFNSEGRKTRFIQCDYTGKNQKDPAMPTKFTFKGPDREVKFK